MSIDWAKVNVLLDVVDGTNPGRWPKLRPIHDAAMAELESLIEELSEPAGPSREERRAAREQRMEEARAAENAQMEEQFRLESERQAAEGNDENRRI